MQTFTDIYHYRFVLSNLVAKNFKTLYRNMALGLMWSLVNPLVMVAVLSVVWVVFFEAPAAFPAMVLVALIPYNFFAYCLSGCASSIIANGSLVKKVAFPRQILPVSVILSHLVHLGIQSALILLAILVFPVPGSILGPALLWLPVILVVQLGLCLGAGLLVAGLNVLYRDVQYMVDSAVLVLFWLSPILYEPQEALARGPRALWFVYHLNPLAGILEAWRSVLYRGESPHLLSFGMAVLVTLLIGYVGVRSFWSHERLFGDLV